MVTAQAVRFVPAPEQICRPRQRLPAHLVTGVTNSPLLAFLVLDGHGPSRAICSRSGADLQASPAAAGAPGHRGNKLPTPGVPGTAHTNRIKH